jgi:hypothetical protein
MSDIDYSTLSTEALIERFVAGALQVGGGTLEVKLDPRSPEAEAIRTEMRAAAAELRARKAIEALRPLYSHESADVRTWAAAQFHAIDPDWASAGTSGLSENMTAPEVLAWRQRTLKRPPRRPAPAEMSLEQLVARFEDAGLRLYGVRFLSDAKGGRDIKNNNRIVGEIIDIWNQLRERGALAALVPLLDHPNVTVRCFAARYCLPVAPEPAVRALEQVEASADIEEARNAWSLLEDWRVGRR